MRFRWLFALLPASCASDVGKTADGGDVVVAPQVIATRALVDRASQLTIQVHNIRSAGLCVPETGEVPVLSEAGLVTQADLRLGGCGDPASYCAKFAVPQGPTLRLFKLTAVDDKGMTFARGCAETIIDKDNENVIIRLTAL